MTDETKLNQAVIYVRVSSKDQVDGYSLSDQERICRDWCASEGYEVRMVFVERGESATTANRTELKKMLTFIEFNHKQLAVVVVFVLDRLTRDTRDFFALKDCIARHGLKLKYASQTFEDTPEGRYQEVETAARGQCENETRGERCRIGTVSAVKAGRFCWVAPLGYRNSRARPGPSLVVDDPETLALIRKSFQLVDAGFSAPRALRQMTQEGLRTRGGSRCAIRASSRC